MTKVCAIFDIGKTNKKFFLFDEDYNIVSEISKQCIEVTDEDGFACDNIVTMTAWIKENLANKLDDQAFEVKAINFSTYGASFVHIDVDGNPLTPLYNYLKPFPESLDTKFYGTYGSKEKIAVETASPSLGNLNSGLQIYWLKYDRPAVFDKTDTSLHLPQYLAYLAHGQRFSDITSIGCHTALWDFQKNDYHDWVKAEGIDQKLAPLFGSDEAIDRQLNNSLVKCGVGLHDSSAAFIPYIESIREPFILISTGTWCITMNPFNNSPLTAEELKADCLCYMTYKGTPVKASRLFAGYEHEQVSKQMADHFKVEKDHFKTVAYDPGLLGEVNFDWPEYKTVPLHSYETYDEAYHQLIYKLVREQKKSTQLVLHNGPVQKIFVDGGFAKNEIYMNLLAKAFPGQEVYAASVSQATALGAAMAIHSHWNSKPIPEDLIRVKRYPD